MSTVTRNQFENALSNRAIDLHHPDLETAVAESGLDVGRLDRLDGVADGRIAGQEALDQLYDEVDALDKKTKGLGSGKEQALFSAVKTAAIAPVPISQAQGLAVADAARQLLAENRRGADGLSIWSYKGASAGENPALSSPSYAKGAYKCNVFAGETLYRAGLEYPLNAHNHYSAAGALPDRSTFIQRLTSIDQVREGDLLSIDRGRDPGHLEVVTGVTRSSDGTVKQLKSIGAHHAGVFEGTDTAKPFLNAHRSGDGSVQLEGETFRILRPLTPPTTPLKG